MSDLKTVNEELTEAVTSGFQKIEDGVVGGYKKIEGAVVGTYQSIEDRFVARCLLHEGETVEQAKERLAQEQAAHMEVRKAESEKRAAEQKARMEAGENTGRPS